MSIKVMSAIFESDLPPGKRLVMLALADHANDEGMCYPSISRLCLRTGMKERTVQTHIRELEADGHLSRDMNKGRSGSNLYHLTPAKSAPPQELHPAENYTPPPQKTARTPAKSAPKPSENHQEPSEQCSGLFQEPDPPKPKKARLPEEWAPTDEDIAYALSLKLTEAEIKEVADDFHAYWTDRTDAAGKKSARGWRQTWRNRCRDVAPQFIRNRRMAGNEATSGHGQSSSIAGIVARRRLEGKV